jgi:hypothetical protein
MKMRVKMIEIMYETSKPNKIARKPVTAKPITV